jgi:hypothetical protein
MFVTGAGHKALGSVAHDRACPRASVVVPAHAADLLDSALRTAVVRPMMKMTRFTHLKACSSISFFISPLYRPPQ